MESSKKINKLTSVIILIVVVLAIGSIYFLMKGRGGDYAPDVKEMIAAFQAEGEDSLQKIDNALKAGKINSETALVYKVYAVFGDENLPSEYEGDKPFYEGNTVVREVSRRCDSLSKGTKDKLAPFRKRPEEEGSWVNLRLLDSQTSAPTSGLVPNAYATRPLATVYTEFLESADGKAKIWYPNTNSNRRALFNEGTTSETVTATQAKKMAEKIKGFLDGDKIFKQFEDLLGGKQVLSDGTAGGDGRLDIYVAPCGSDLGLTYCEGSTPCPSYIIMNSSIGLARDNVLKTTLAHEIFHAFQYAYDYDDTKDNWWSEATAVWSEDFIYPFANTEHAWLPRFIPHPTSQADKESPPSGHHYGAYILSYFITENFGDDFMRKSWNACDGGPCLKGIDDNIEGGFKEQWKKFTLWNYNKEPAQYYVDAGPFPTHSSMDAPSSDEIPYTGGDENIDIEELKPLAADLTEVYNMITDTNLEGWKKITFKDFDQFTSKSDKAAIKAVVYLKNGQKMVEDWTKKKKRSFCLENKDEDLERVVLIYSNADMKEGISASKIKVESKKSCFHIDERESRTAVVHFPAQGGAVNINTTIDAVADGEPEKDASEEVDFGYQTEWSVWYEFEQIKEAFSVPCEDTTADFEAGWTTRAAGYLKFNLDPESEGYDKETNTFSIDMHYGELHPNGPYEDVPGVGVNCAGIYIGPSKVDLSGFKGVYKGIYTGKITNMTPDGAIIEIENCCLYHDCYRQDGPKFQTISEPILLEIKRFAD